jgi:hypothetical protein
MAGGHSAPWEGERRYSPEEQGVGNSGKTALFRVITDRKVTLLRALE